jgi:hypothetical protein
MPGPRWVDNACMVGPGRWRKKLALGLALWASLPSLQWCPFSWEECWKLSERSGAAAACVAVGGPASTVAVDPLHAGTCPAQGGSCASPCDGEARACAAGSRSCASPCDRRPDPVPFRDCAWCIRSPIDGVPVRGLDLPSSDAGPLMYAAVTAPRLRPPARAALERLESTTACPAIHAPHAPPQSRAPPSPTTSGFDVGAPYSAHA